MEPFNSSPLTYRQKKIVWMILGRHGTSASPLPLPAHHFFPRVSPTSPLSPPMQRAARCVMRAGQRQGLPGRLLLGGHDVSGACSTY